MKATNQLAVQKETTFYIQPCIMKLYASILYRFSTCTSQHVSTTILCPVEIDGLDPQKREMLEARITGRVST